MREALAVGWAHTLAIRLGARIGRPVRASLVVQLSAHICGPVTRTHWRYDCVCPLVVRLCAHIGSLLHKHIAAPVAPAHWRSSCAHTLLDRLQASIGIWLCARISGPVAHAHC